MLKINLHSSRVYSCKRVSVGLIVTYETAKKNYLLGMKIDKL